MACRQLVVKLGRFNYGLQFDYEQLCTSVF